MSEIPKAYEPQAVEEKWYQFWCDQGCFTANPHSPKPAYSIVIPPPNVTGVLHMGHVLNNTIQDILSRKARMDGKEVLWLPGTDHAGIATQAVVEKALRKQGLMKHRDDIGRDRFLEHVWAWKEKNGGIIIQQLKKLGCSCDWTRERFTMDPAYSKCVQKVFVELYRKNLIYRGKRMVNWDPAARTALSDEEVEMIEEKGHLWHLKYPLLDDRDQPKADEFVIVATTRPETMLGDEAVAVNPNDPRYRHLVGRRCWLPLQNKPIPVIADELVDPKFGTGCVKVTPAHDPADYEMAVRHNLPLTVVIGPDGVMTELAGEDFGGMDRLEARQAVIEELTGQGLLVKTDDYVHNVGYSERSHVPIEPYLSEQWFLKYPSVDQATACVSGGSPGYQPVPPGDPPGGTAKPHPDAGGTTSSAASSLPLGGSPTGTGGSPVPPAPRMRFYPDRWAKTYAHWMHHLRDWCISRQLWWGHRVPVWRHKYLKADLRRTPRLAESFWPAEQASWLVENTQLRMSLPAEGSALAEKKTPAHPAGTYWWHVVAEDEEAIEIEAVTDSDIAAEYLVKQGYLQDPDVLDTWFSSWLWPFATMGWPESTDTLKKFYPTTDLVTGPDIIFFWVARMIMAGYAFMGEARFGLPDALPFRNVYFTGIIRDKLGRKMSKSLGNSPDPLELIAKYGADALRFGTMRSAPLGQDVLFDEKDVELGRNFCNKLWNACRFRQMQGGDVQGEIDPDRLTSDDKWIMLRLDHAIRELTASLAEYNFSEAAQTLYRFFWGEFCDWYLEACKASLNVEALKGEAVKGEAVKGEALKGDGAAAEPASTVQPFNPSTVQPFNPSTVQPDSPSTNPAAARRANTLAVLDFVLSHTLRLFHPFLPFITEELWHGMGYHEDMPADQGGNTIMFAPWPKAFDADVRDHYSLDDCYLEFAEAKQELVNQGRNLRREKNIPANKKVKFILKPAEAVSPIDQAVLQLLLNAETLEVNAEFQAPKGMPSVRITMGELYLPLEGLIDVTAEKARLAKELARADAEVEKAQQKLNNPAFVQKVPPHVLQEHQNRLADWTAKRDQAQRALEHLTGG